MEDSGAILYQISSLKDMLDQVNEEIEASLQLTREIDSEIVKCCELESGLQHRESELTQISFVSQFEIHGLTAFAGDARGWVKSLEEELCCLNKKRDEIIARMNIKREAFSALCLNFQKEIEPGENDEPRVLLLEKESLQNEVNHLDRKANALKTSMTAFAEGMLEDLHSSNSALSVEIQTAKGENEKLQTDIDGLKTTLISIISTEDLQW